MRLDDKLLTFGALLFVALCLYDLAWIEAIGVGLTGFPKSVVEFWIPIGASTTASVMMFNRIVQKMAPSRYQKITAIFALGLFSILLPLAAPISLLVGGCLIFRVCL